LDVNVDQGIVKYIYEINNKVIQVNVPKQDYCGDTVAAKAKDQAHSEIKKQRTANKDIIVALEKRQIFLLQALEAFVNEDNEKKESPRNECREIKACHSLETQKIYYGKNSKKTHRPTDIFYF
jgi:hypothetical protein